MLPRLIDLKRAALDLFFPQRCLGCGEEGVLICPECLKSLPRILPPICPKCGRPQPSGLLCTGCIGRQSDIEGIRSPLKFEGTVREAIHQFKYKNLRSLSLPLADILGKYLEGCDLPLQVLVPVPLHRRRYRERGYNQSALLARELGKHINAPVEEDCLVRTKYVLPQAKTKSAEERHYNVKEAFYCRSSVLMNKQVVLVDDVATSGATLEACAAALKSSGTLSVWGLVLAREL